MTCTVTGNLVDLTTEDVAYAGLIFEPLIDRVRPLDGRATAPNAIKVDADAGGNFTVNLLPGGYAVKVYRGGRGSCLVTVPDAASAAFHAIIDLPVPVDIDQAEAAVIAAEEARDKAAEWATSPEDVEVETGEYSALHHYAKAFAQRALAETARAAAEAAQGLAEGARNGSETAQGLSEAARDASQAARSGAEAAENLAQDWANKGEDSPILPGQFSSLHYAKKAAADALSAANDLASVQTAKTQVEMIFDSFDDTYLGSFSTANEPTTDNDGDTLKPGAFYWNTDVEKLRFHVGGGVFDDADAAASAYADAAQASANAAEAARQAAVTAQGASETARDAAQAAQGLSETARNASQSAQGLSEAARDAAQTAKTDAEAAWNSFVKHYLGSKASAPSVDNEGGALITGALYFDTVDNSMYVYGGTGWNSAQYDSSNVAITGGSISGISNLGVGISTPQEKLHVLDGIKISSADQSSGRVILGDGGTTKFGVGLARWNGSTNTAGAGGMGYFAKGPVDGGGHFWYTGDADAGAQSERMRVDATGKVLVNKTAPYSNEMFSVKGELRAGNVVNTTDSVFLGVDATGNPYLGTSAAGKAFKFENNGERMRIDSEGKVGIGVTTPTSALHIKKNAHSAALRMSVENEGYLSGALSGIELSAKLTSGATKSWFIDNHEHALKFKQGNSEYMRIAENGNVGIRTGTPGGTLEVKQRVDGEGIRMTHSFRPGIWDMLHSGVNGEDLVWRQDDGAGSDLMFRVGRNGTYFYKNDGTEVGGINGNSGNFGIGTTTPGHKLVIEDNSPFILLNNLTETASGIQYADAQNSGERFQATFSSLDAKYALTRVESDGSLTDRMVIDNVGRVGIGTSSPTSKLTINDPGVQIELTTTEANAVIKTGRVGVKHYTNSEEPAAFLSGGSTGNDNIINIGGGTSAMNAATIIGFYTASNTTTTNGSERMRIDSEGSVLINASGQPLASRVELYAYNSATANTNSDLLPSQNPVAFFDCDTAGTNNEGASSALLLRYRRGQQINQGYLIKGYGNDSSGNTNVFNVWHNGDVKNLNNSYGALSDQRIKTNIRDAGSQWADIKALRLRKYSMLESEEGAPDQIGVVAQELEQTSPGLVDQPADPDGYKSVKYSVLYMKAVGALQEALNRIEQLETRIDQLEAT